MKSFYIFTLLLASTLALSLLQLRNIPGAVYYCTGKAFAAPCWYAKPYSEDTWICTDVEDPEQKRIRSFGPDQGLSVQYSSTFLSSEPSMEPLELTDAM